MSVMYSIRPGSVVPENIDLPKCMYRVKPLNGTQQQPRLNESPIIKQVKMEPALQAVNDKQLEVIANLRKLRDVVDTLIKNSGGPSSKPIAAKPKASVAGESCKSFSLNAVAPSELVVEADPSRPPFSLVFFRNLQSTVTTISHTHSSCKEQVNPKLAALFTHDSKDVSSTVRVVWKSKLGNQSSCLTPPNLGSCRVDGESNVARYLSRVFSKPGTNLNYDDLSETDLALVDAVLELSEHVDSNAEQFLNSLQAYIQRQVNTSSRTIADYVAYSTLQYLTKKKQSKPLNKQIVDWMNCLTNEAPFLC